MLISHLLIYDKYSIDSDLLMIIAKTEYLLHLRFVNIQRIRLSQKICMKLIISQTTDWFLITYILRTYLQ